MSGFAASGEAAASRAEEPASRLGVFLRRIFSSVSVRRAQRRLRLCEMVSLGEKRFVAVVEYGQEKFILAGTPHSISLLKSFGAVCADVREAPHREPSSE